MNMTNKQVTLTNKKLTIRRISLTDWNGYENIEH